MNSLISVCIPTYRRPQLLEIAAGSALLQTYPHVEVIIGDDSPDNQSAESVATLRDRFPHRLRYIKNEPKLGQNQNVNRLFDLARGDRLVLLHDDDVLLSDALQCLDAAWQPHTFIAFGKQQIISSKGQLLPTETSKLNKRYCRETHFAGVQKSALVSALLQQIPNDGFMVTTAAAKSTGYRSAEEVGVYCDLDFNLRLTETHQSGTAAFIDHFVSQYRISEDSISGSGSARQSDHPTAAAIMYEMVAGMGVCSSLKRARKVLLRRLAVKAVKGYALSGCRKKALRIFFSDCYPALQRVTWRGLYHFALIVSPTIDRFRRYSHS